MAKTLAIDYEQALKIVLMTEQKGIVSKTLQKESTKDSSVLGFLQRIKEEADLQNDKESEIKQKTDVILPPLPDMVEIAEKYMQGDLDDNDFDSKIK